MTVRDALGCVVIAAALAGLAVACRVSNVGTGPSGASPADAGAPAGANGPIADAGRP